MYGMLYESVQHYIQQEYGMETWRKVCQIVDCKHQSFKTHQIYPDKLMPDFAAALSASTGESFDFCMNFFGRCFVRFFSNLQHSLDYAFHLSQDEVAQHAVDQYG